MWFLWVSEKKNKDYFHVQIWLIGFITETERVCWAVVTESFNRVQLIFVLHSCNNLRIIRTVRTGKLWRRVEIYHAYVPSSKRTLENARGSLLVTLQRPHYLSRVDHERKIRSRRQRTDIGKYSFVNRTIQHWNQLPTEVLGILPCKPITFKKRVRKVIIELN